MFIKSFSKKLFSHKYIKNKHILRENNIAVLEGKKKTIIITSTFFKLFFFFWFNFENQSQSIKKYKYVINCRNLDQVWTPNNYFSITIKLACFFFFFNNSIITLTGWGIWALKVSNEYTKMYQLVVIQDSWQLA